MMQAQKSACIFYGNRVRYNYFLYSLIHMTAGSFLSSDTDSVESIFHRTVVKKRANFNWTSSDGEKDTKKAFISMVSDAVYPAGLLSSK